MATAWNAGLAVVVVAGLASLAARIEIGLPCAYSCFDSVYYLLGSFLAFGSRAQWMVALLGLCLYPAFSRSGRPAGAVGSSSPSVQGSSCRACGPGSHSIQLESSKHDTAQPRGAGVGFLRRLRRLLADSRSQARRLCGRESLQKAVSGLTRKRSFGSRSSKSEDVLSSRLSMDSMLRAAQQNAGGGGARRGLLQRKGSVNQSGATRWQPSMSRITSGQHLACLAPSESSVSSAGCGKRLEILSYNGFQAVDCISAELTDPAFSAVRAIVTDTHLLQFGAVIGEASARLALSQAGSGAAVGPEPGCLFGPYDRKDAYATGWELIVEEHKPGIHYWNWRRHLRKGLYMYKSKTLYETATTAQIVGFTYDLEFRRTWDDSMMCQLPIPPPPAACGEGGDMSLAEADAKGSGGRSAFMYARTKFPPPMASRDYVYARRCWAKPDDGGCYCISRACTHPSPPAAGGRAVRISDFVSGYVIRASKGIFDTANPAVEVVNVYFEDPCVPSGIANMSIRRALWPMVQKAEAAFRDYLLTRVHGGLEQPPPERTAPLDSLGAAMGAGAAQAARAAAAAADADAASWLGALPRAWVLQLPLRRLGSPYLLYRAYMAVYRAGRAALLAALSCGMSLWCNATGLCVSALAAARSGAHAAAAGGRTALGSALKQLEAAASTALQAARSCAQGDAGARNIRALLRIMWPWEVALRALGGPRPAQPGSVTSSSLQRTASGSSVSNDRLSSHPLPGSGAAAKRLSFAQRAGAGGPAVQDDGQLSPRGSGGGASGGAVKRARAGFMRKCALVAVKVAKLAGAKILLERAARSGSGAQQAAAASGSVSGAQLKATSQAGYTAQQQQYVSGLAGRTTVAGRRW